MHVCSLRAVMCRVALAASLLFACVAVGQGATLPAGFSELLVAGGISSPTAMDFAPDGRLFVCQKGGQLRVIENGVLLPTPFVSLTVNQSGERGLLGVAFDPNFAINKYVYVYYTSTASRLHNRVSRFTANGNVAVPGSEVPVLDDLPTLSATNHNGGAIHFGPDGKLYAAVGENAVPGNSQMRSNGMGKILRINADGSIPADNPFYNEPGAYRSIWAFGLRNPYTFAFNPGSGVPAMAINDVGAGQWEEINDGLAGANYGWPDSEGETDDPAFTSPRFAYEHVSNQCAITGGAFYVPAVMQFPADYLDDYFFADNCAGWIRRLDPNNGNSVTTFATGIPGPVDLKVGPDGALYYLSIGNGAVYRVFYTAAPPTQAPPTGLAAHVNGLTVVLSWNAAPGATSYRLEAGSSSGAANLFNGTIGNVASLRVAVAAGTYYVRLRATGALGTSNPSNQVIVTTSGRTVCAVPPPAPTGFAVQAAGLAARLSWTASPGADSYVVEAGSATGLANVLATNVGPVGALDASGPAGTYFTRVRAVNTCGAGAASTEVRVTLGCSGQPAAPSNLSFGKSGAIVVLAWTGSPGATSYRVTVGSSPAASNVTVTDVGRLTTLPVNTTGVPAGLYYVRISAIGACGLSGPSNEIAVSLP